MIHQYKLNGRNIVIDVYSGSVHLVDDVAYDIIRLFCEKSREEIVDQMMAEYGDREDVTREEVEACWEDVLALKEMGKLFTEDVWGPNANFLKNRHTEIKALCLHVAHSCDLTCSYCFAGQGRFHGKSALMSAEVGRRAIDFLIENSGDRHNLEVDFFGGEPLLNFDVVKEVVRYARSIEKAHNKNFRFTLTTNGMGITDEVIDFANRECHNVVLSLDGRREIHDRERRTRDGRGSYDIILPKFKKLVEARGDKNYYMRGTFTHYNPDFTKDIFHMADLGFTELSMEPVVCDPQSRFALTEEDLPVLFEQYEILAEEMLKREKEGRPFTFYHYMIDLGHGPCIYKRISGCGSGTEYFAVTPQGDLYPCHQFVGEEKFRMGDIWNGVTAEDVRQDFKMCNVYAREECRDCWAKLYCSGGCAANAFHATGDIRGVYEYGCKLFRKRMECAIMREVVRLEWAEEEAGTEA
ncbi:MAG: thioether cross-link-forming SCIFF peptide maturase [Eubacterium sp.]|nr:thioether cross-link-forming SCIFF peptide maturase [Eubacterium sp.]